MGDLMNPRSVLIFDDEPNVRTLVRECLKPKGYRIAEAGDGLEAFKAIELSPRDVALLDLSMPRMDGISLLAKLRSLHHKPTMRSIVMTAHGSVRHAIEAVRLGACDFLEKPFAPDHLRLSVACALHEPLDGESTERAGYAELLGIIRRSLRTGDFKAAEQLLGTTALMAEDEPEYLNLAGVFVEANGRRADARKYYERALRIKPDFVAPLNNLLRIEELEQLGHSDRDVTLGNSEWFTDPESVSGMATQLRRADTNEQ